MLDQAGFDLWAGGYDVSVGLSDEEDSYPFAGYKRVLNEIYSRILRRGSQTVLDIGFGTGVLAARLAEAGCRIWGQDFSSRMIELAGQKMPEARLYQGDFSQGLVEPLKKQRYDAIVATYSLHHLTDEGKIQFLQQLLGQLNPGGSIYIGDVAFATRAGLESCRVAGGEEWDDEEIYFVFEELRSSFPHMTFTPCSACAGLIEIRL